jgi:hypothetical protein
MDKRKKIALIVVIIAIFIAIITTIIFRKKTINEVKIENIVEAEYQYFVVKSNEKYGVIDTKGNNIIEAKYDEVIIPNPKKAVFICTTQNSDKNDILNENNEKIFTIYDNVEAIQINGLMLSLPYEKSVLKYSVNGKYGLIDFDGNRITKAIYDEIDGLKYKEGELCVKSNDKYGVIDINGNKIINFEYDAIEGDKFYEEQYEYSNSGYITCNITDDGYRYGYVSKDSKKILDTKYNSVKRITDINGDDLYFIVCNNGQFGLIKNDENVIDFKYQSIEYNSLNNLLTVCKGVNYGVYTMTGEEVVPIEYKTIQYNGICIYAKNGEEISYFYNNGEKIENDITSLQPVNNGEYYISIDKDGLYGIVDSNQQQLCDNKYVYIEFLFDGLFSAYKNGSGFGIINSKGNTIIQHKYTVLNKIGNSDLIKAENMENNTIQIYASNLEIIAELEDSELDIRDNYIKLENDEKEIYIDMNGNVIDANTAIQISEESPETIGNYKKEYFEYSQVRYTDDD